MRKVKEDTLVLHTKCDLNTSFPYSTLSSCLSLWTESVLNGDEKELRTVATEVLTATFPNTYMLAEVFPGLQQIIGKQATSAGILSEDRKQRFREVWLKFFHYLLSVRPVIFFVDDIQWYGVFGVDLIFLQGGRWITGNFTSTCYR